MDIKEKLRIVPDFPKPGIQFYDITPVLLDPQAFNECLDWMEGKLEGTKIDKIAGIESRGFIFGAALASRLGVGFIPIRKPGKLPYDVKRIEYEKEYGVDSLEVHSDSIKPGDRVVLVDDVLATGGTASAAIKLIESLDGDMIAVLFMIKLIDLNADLHGTLNYSMLSL